MNKTKRKLKWSRIRRIRRIRRRRHQESRALNVATIKNEQIKRGTNQHTNIKKRFE